MAYQSDLVIDLDALRSAHAVMQNKFLKILNYYYEDTEAYITVIEEGIEKKDVAMIVPAAHTIKSSSKQLGAEQLALAAADLEIFSRELLKGTGDFVDILLKAETIKALFQRSRDQLDIATKELFSA